MDWDSDKYQQQLEAEIQRELEGLPELKAPPTLSRRVMAAIAARAAMPWYKLPWEYWPTPLRMTTLACLLAAFGGLCFASWQLTQAAGFTAAMQEVSQAFSGAVTIWNALTTIVSALALVIKHLNTLWLVAIGLTCAAGYAGCVGLGTMFYRMAFAARK